LTAKKVVCCVFCLVTLNNDRYVIEIEEIWYGVVI